MRTPAEALLNVDLPNGWTIVENVPYDKTTGGNHSCAYIVENRETGQRAFLKALDFEPVLKNSEDVLKALGGLITAFEFERDLCLLCNSRNLSNVVVALDHGQIRQDPRKPWSVVPYIIFELGEVDIRTRLSTLKSFDATWMFRVLHNTAVGIRQLHANQIAHQDIKPSNIVQFSDISKLGDLGRASRRETAGPFDNDFGDPNYAPPERLYGSQEIDWLKTRRAADVYQLGNLAVFLHSNASLTSLLETKLPFSQRSSNWNGTYREILPYLVNAIEEILDELQTQMLEWYRAELTEAIRQLCYPDPSRRGNPLQIAYGLDQLDLERYISMFDRLSRQSWIYNQQ